MNLILNGKALIRSGSRMSMLQWGQMKPKSYLKPYVEELWKPAVGSDLVSVAAVAEGLWEESMALAQRLQRGASKPGHI